MILSGSPQPLFDQRDLVLGRRHSVLRFLLEGVEHIDNAREPHGVDGAVGVAVMVVDHFQLCDDVRHGRVDLSGRIDVYDGEGNLVLSLPFSQAVELVLEKDVAR